MQKLPIVIFIVFAIWLTIIDIRVKRLPNKLVLANSILVYLAILLTANESQLIMTSTCGLTYFVLFLGLATLRKNSIGFGDVKFSISCGFVIGYYVPSAWLLNIWLMFVIAGLLVLPKLIFRSIGLTDRIAFGPAMAIATIGFALNSLT